MISSVWEGVSSKECLSVSERSEWTEVLKIAVRRHKDFGGATILAALGFGRRGKGLQGALPCRSLSVRSKAY